MFNRCVDAIYPSGMPMTNPQLHRTNLNLHASDVAFLQHTYGYGWTEQARELLHQRVEQIKRERTASGRSPEMKEPQDEENIPD